MAQTAANIENKSPEAAYVCKDNILLQDDTCVPTSVQTLSAAAQAQYATIRAAHLTKMDAEATAKETRAALPYQGNVSGNVKRGKG